MVDDHYKEKELRLISRRCHFLSFNTFGRANTAHTIFQGNVCDANEVWAVIAIGQRCLKENVKRESLVFLFLFSFICLQANRKKKKHKLPNLSFFFYCLLRRRKEEDKRKKKKIGSDSLFVSLFSIIDGLSKRLLWPSIEKRRPKRETDQ